jgi:predicted PurR-regulated permease PerM
VTAGAEPAGQSMSDPPLPEPPPSLRLGAGAGWTRSRVIFLAIAAALALLLLFLVRDVLLPFILAVTLAYVLTPLVAVCEQRTPGRFRGKRAVSILLVYTVTISILYFSLAAIMPRVYAETVTFVREAPGLAAQASRRLGPKLDAWVQNFVKLAPKPPPIPPPQAPALIVTRRADGYNIELGSGVDVVQDGKERWRVVAQQPPSPRKFRVADVVEETTNNFFDYLNRNAFALIKLGQVVISKIARGIFLTFMVLMVAGYLMHTRENIMGFFRSLPPQRARPGFDRLLQRMDRGLAGVVRGQLLICLVNGVLTAIGLWMFELKYWPILAIIAGVMSLIPIFGSILSTIPAVAIGLTQDFWTALWVLLWIVGIHQVEANLLNPKIIGVAAKIHPVLVVFALIIGEHFYGLWGALFAVPVLSVVQSVFNHFRFESMPDSGPDSLLPPAPAPAVAPVVVTPVASQR